MTQDVAVLKAQIASISAIIPELMKQKIRAKGAQLIEGLNWIGRVAENAREHGIDMDAKALGEVGIQVLQIADDKNPDIAAAAREATIELLNYQSFLNRKAMPDISGAKPIPVPNAVKFPGHAHSGQPLDMTVEYVGVSGGSSMKESTKQLSVLDPK